MSSPSIFTYLEVPAILKFVQLNGLTMKCYNLGVSLIQKHSLIMANKWDNVTREHILFAIQEFENSKEPYPPARNTFLLHNNIEYSAKHILGLAYKIANKKEIYKPK